MDQVWLARLRGGGGAASPVDDTAGDSAAAAAASAATRKRVPRRIPRALFEYQPLCGQVRMFSTTSGSIFSSASGAPGTPGRGEDGFLPRRVQPLQVQLRQFQEVTLGGRRRSLRDAFR